MSKQFEKINEAISHLKQGKMIILVDDESRENEGDFVFAAEHVTPELVNFMVKHARGLVCVSLPEKRADQLNLPLMSQSNNSRFNTAFTVSVEAKEGVTTGISAFDRAKTISVLVNNKYGKDDIVTPGHIFPLKAKKGGVLERKGHTEGALDLVKISGLSSAAVICEIMNDDGTMARKNDLEKVSLKYNIPIVSIQDIVEYRLQGQMVREVSRASLPNKSGDFRCVVYENIMNDIEHFVLIKGDPSLSTPLVRVHSECLTGDIFGSSRCDCGDQLNVSLQMIEQSQCGVFIYMRGHEGRGIGLGEKIKAYSLQEQGFDTVDANLHLGFAEDLRDYSDAASILKILGAKNIKLLTNNPNKSNELNFYGIDVLERVSVETEYNKHNKDYMFTKKNRMGHVLDSIKNLH